MSIDYDGNIVPREPTSNVAVVLSTDWSIGIGLIILWSGAGLKLIHFFCHCCIPTPSITRDIDEQEEYEKIGQPEEGLIDIMAQSESSSSSSSSSSSDSS